MPAPPYPVTVPVELTERLPLPPLTTVMPWSLPLTFATSIATPVELPSASAEIPAPSLPVTVPVDVMARTPLP